MSDEQTRSDAPETTDAPAAEQTRSDAPEATDAPTAESEQAETTSESTPSGDEAGSAEASASEAAEVSVKEAPASQAAFAATVLGDTLPSAVRTALASGGDHGHGHGGGHAAAGHDDEHFAHTLPMKILGGVLGALVVLTVLTVAVTSVDLGSQGNFIVAMIIATIKAALVMGYFMHLVWDSKFNVFVFLSSFLFVLLFLSMALLDRGEYQTGIDSWEVDQKTAK